MQPRVTNLFSHRTCERGAKRSGRTLRLARRKSPRVRRPWMGDLTPTTVEPGFHRKNKGYDRAFPRTKKNPEPPMKLRVTIKAWR